MKKLFKSIIVLILLNIITSPAQGIFDSLTHFILDDGTEVFTIGDSHVGGGSPDAENSKRDAQDSALLQSALHTWNQVGNFAYLGESNSDIAKQNSKILQQQLQDWKKNTHLKPPYWGIYYTIPEYIENNNKQLSNIAFNMCDNRGKAFFDTKEAIFKLQDMFTRIDATMKANKAIWIEKDGLQQNIHVQFKESSKVRAQDFLNELQNAVTTIKTAISDKENFLDEITQKELEFYAESLNNGIVDLETFFKKQLNNDLTKSTFEAIIQQVITTANLDKKNQTNRETAFSCINESLSVLSKFNEQYEKITNYGADAGFILALQKQKKTHNKIALFMGNNHAMAIFGYLNKYKDIGKAYNYFAQGSLKYRYIPSEHHHLSHDHIRTLFCIPFNKNFVSKNIPSLTSSEEQLKQSTKPFACQTCPKISIDKQFNKCSQCKDIYYCSRDCQKNDWNNHKTTCKKVAPSPIITQNQINQILPIIQTKSQLLIVQNSQDNQKIEEKSEQNNTSTQDNKLQVTPPATIFGYKIFSDNSPKK